MERGVNFKLCVSRIELRLTVTDAARIVQVDPQTYRCWELGRKMPQMTSLALLCRAFKKTSAELGY
jgi:DNA-binding XRE family transcriptional regulator